MVQNQFFVVQQCVDVLLLIDLCDDENELHIFMTTLALLRSNGIRECTRDLGNPEINTPSESAMCMLMEHKNCVSCASRGGAYRCDGRVDGVL